MIALPWYENQGISVPRILTDRGTEYSGKIENHAYQLFLSIEDIDHSRTKRIIGICESHKNRIYDMAFRKKIKNVIGRIANRCRYRDQVLQ